MRKLRKCSAEPGALVTMGTPEAVRAHKRAHAHTHMVKMAVPARKRDTAAPRISWKERQQEQAQRAVDLCGGGQGWSAERSRCRRCRGDDDQCCCYTDTGSLASERQDRQREPGSAGGRTCAGCDSAANSGKVDGACGAWGGDGSISGSLGGKSEAEEEEGGAEGATTRSSREEWSALASELNRRSLLRRTTCPSYTAREGARGGKGGGLLCARGERVVRRKRGIPSGGAVISIFILSAFCAAGPCVPDAPLPSHPPLPSSRTADIQHRACQAPANDLGGFSPTPDSPRMPLRYR